MSDIEHNGFIGHPITNMLTDVPGNPLTEMLLDEQTRPEPAPDATTEDQP
jgi:hypothetical protein